MFIAGFAFLPAWALAVFSADEAPAIPIIGGVAVFFPAGPAGVFPSEEIEETSSSLLEYCTLLNMSVRCFGINFSEQLTQNASHDGHL
jgi:hypothetical protein